MKNLPKVGIDIGAATIKVAEMSPAGGNKWRLINAASMPTPGGGILGNQNYLAPMVQSIIKILREAGIKNKKAVISLPEDQISTHLVEMPLMNDSEIRQALNWQVEQYIPIPADKAVWSFQVLDKDKAKGEMEILLVATTKSLINQYTQVMEQAGLEVLALETELTAAARAEVPDNAPLTLLVDIGARGTNMGIVRSGQLVFSRTIPTAGDAFSRAIETTLGLDPIQAEQYKNTYGFSNDKLEGKLVEVMKPVLNIIGAEIKKTIDFYTSKHTEERVRLIALSGGVAVVPEIVSNLSGMVGVEVAVADPLNKVVLDKEQARSLVGTAPFYGVALGLAMRDI